MTATGTQFKPKAVLAIQLYSNYDFRAVMNDIGINDKMSHG